ncbi:MAG: DNRLRE domain-containing protein [Agarilytica sp.]
MQIFHKHIIHVYSLIICTILFISQNAFSAQVVSIIPAQDTSIFLEKPLLNLGAASTLTLKPQSSTYNAKARTLIKFDLEALAERIVDEELVSARLQLYVSMNNGEKGVRGKFKSKGRSSKSSSGVQGAGYKIDIHPLSADWDEKDATWYCPSATDCGHEGGRFGRKTDSLDMSNVFSGAVQFDVTNDVKHILSGASNFGWLIKKRLESAPGIFEFFSSESDLKPQLILTVNAPEGADITAPKIELTQPNKVFYLGESLTQVVVTYSDFNDGVDTSSVQVKVAGNVLDCDISVGLAVCPVNTLENGIYSVEASVADFSGNTSTANKAIVYNAEAAGGTGGVKWITDIGAPEMSVGANGDNYLDLSNGDFYQKISGIWQLLANLTGPEGAQGASGEPGPQGEQGVSGAVGPKGDQGPRGPQGIAGEIGPLGMQGPQGLPGPQGIQGLAGPAGPAGQDGKANNVFSGRINLDQASDSHLASGWSIEEINDGQFSLTHNLNSSDISFTYTMEVAIGGTGDKLAVNQRNSNEIIFSHTDYRGEVVTGNNSGITALFIVVADSALVPVNQDDASEQEDETSDPAEVSILCRNILEDNPNAISGTYTVDVLGQSTEFYCDMSFDLGGWTLVGSVYDKDRQFTQNVVQGSNTVLSNEYFQELLKNASVGVRFQWGSGSTENVLVRMDKLGGHSCHSLDSDGLFGFTYPGSDSVLWAYNENGACVGSGSDYSMIYLRRTQSSFSMFELSNAASYIERYNEDGTWSTISEGAASLFSLSDSDYIQIYLK